MTGDPDERVDDATQQRAVGGWTAERAVGGWRAERQLAAWTAERQGSRELAVGQQRGEAAWDRVQRE